MKERPALPSSESFTTRQDLQGKITSLDTSTMRAAMKPGWEDLVRRCIQKFHTQHEGESLSYAKRHHHEGMLLCTLRRAAFAQSLPVALLSGGDAQSSPHRASVTSAGAPRPSKLLEEIKQEALISQRWRKRSFSVILILLGA